MSDNIEDKNAVYQAERSRLARHSAVSEHEFRKACAMVLSTAAGQTVIEGLKLRANWYGQRFSDEDGYNTHAAASRDGACGLISTVEIEAARHKSHAKTED